MQSGLKVTILGSGTSVGVPQVGCPCPVCHSDDPRDRRLRASALLETDEGRRLLIDCGPDFRQQMLSVDFLPLDGVNRMLFCLTLRRTTVGGRFCFLNISRGN